MNLSGSQSVEDVQRSLGTRKGSSEGHAQRSAIQQVCTPLYNFGYGVGLVRLKVKLEGYCAQECSWQLIACWYAEPQSRLMMSEGVTSR